MSTAYKRLQQTLHTVIFGHSTRAGRLFDVVLLWSILLSVGVVILESVKAIDQRYHQHLKVIEWGFTILFTLEYLARIISLRKPWLYIRSYFGIIDLLSILPTWLSLLFPNTHFMLAIRLMRLLRVFRILKLSRYVSGALHIRMALRNSLPKITVFFLFVLTMVTILGTIMYMVEGGQHGFSSIPQSIYWSIVTLTTVGYGDITPVTPLGKIVASVIMILGYSIIAVPTGIVSAEMSHLKDNHTQQTVCAGCGQTDHEADALYCKKCGQSLKS